MAFTHYIAVRDSDLYEYKGLTKPVLMTIAHLIISEPKENEQGKIIGERDPNAGWCVAGEEYIAAALGCSADAVSNHVNTIRQDGWIEVVTWRNRFGHPHNKYRIPADKLEEIKAHAYKKDEQGKIIRGSQDNKSRKMSRGSKGKFTPKAGIGHAYADPNQALVTSDSRVVDSSSRQGAVELLGTEPSSSSASCSKPHGTEPSVVGLSEFDQQVVGACDKTKQHSDKTDSHREDSDQSPKQQPTLSVREFAQAVGAVEQSSPVNSSTTRPHSAAPRHGKLPSGDKEKHVCKSLNCGGPLTGNKPDGVCRKCGHKPLVKQTKAEAIVEESTAPHKFPKGDLSHEAMCLNPGCQTNRMGSRYDASQKYCEYAQQGAAV